MNNTVDNPADASTPAQAPGLAVAAMPAAQGHFDELRGGPSSGTSAAQDASHSIANDPGISGPWRQFFQDAAADGRGDLNQRAADLARQIRDNGVAYNIHGDVGAPQRPWSVGLLPLIIEPHDWQHIESGVTQRMRLLERVMADVYGAQDLLAQGLLPPALVLGHPGYVRAMHGVQRVGATHLHIAAFDLARAPDGNWRVVAQRTQVPSGLGYLLENRLALAGLFPQALQSLRVQGLAGTYRSLVDRLKGKSPAGQDAHVALLTPGPYNASYFEHAYLARHLGITLVEGNDLIVRDQRLFLKTLRGLVPVHGLIKCLDDAFLDPLELRADSSLGVPGLLQAMRAGQVLVANAPGSAFLESAALLGFLPALAQHLLGEALLLPAPPTWWCGERAAMLDVLPRLKECTIGPTYPGSTVHGGFAAVPGQALSPDEIDAWTARIQAHGDDHTVQAQLPQSQMPTWPTDGACLVPRSVVLRVFAVSQGPDAWRVLPGGLARVAGDAADVAALQFGGSSADVWAMATGDIDTTPLQQAALTPASLAQHKRLLSSRAAQSLFWLGRYTERAENSVRLARITLQCLGDEDQSAQPLLNWLGRLALNNSLVPPGTVAPTPAAQGRHAFERSLIASLAGDNQATSVGYNLRALRLAGAAVRERLSQEHWGLLRRAEESFFESCARLPASADHPCLQALAALKTASEHLSAISGWQTERMARDDGWRMLCIGRHIERLGFLSSALRTGFETGSVRHSGGFAAMLALFDSSTPFLAQYQHSQDVAALVDLLVLERDNPRSLACALHRLRGWLAVLALGAPDPLSGLAHGLPDPAPWQLQALCEPGADAAFGALSSLLFDCTDAAYRVSEEIGATCFTYCGDAAAGPA